MAFLQQIQLHCTPLTRNQRVELTRYWLSLPSYIPSFLKTLIGIFPEEEIHLCLLHKSLAFLAEFRDELLTLGFTTADNFMSAGWALLGLLLIMYLHLPLSAESIDSMLIRIRPYLLIYIIVDHTLDDNKISYTEFKEAFFNTLINKPTISQNKLIIYTCALLKEIMVLSPLSLPYIIKVAKIEFESVEHQSEGHDVLTLCHNKGAASALAGCALMSNGIIYEGTSILGFLAQLFDDIMDIEEDIVNGINTYVTQTLDTDTNIDICVHKLGTLIQDLPTVYTKIKIWLLHFIATYLINSKYISISLRQQLLPYSFLLYRGHGYSINYFEVFFHAFSKSLST